MNYFAQPYDLAASGFYFDSLDEYAEKAAANTNSFGQPVEEYEIQLLEGDFPRLFRELSIDQGSLHTWFELIESLSETDMVKCLYLAADLGMDASQVLDADLSEVYLFQGSAIDYAYNCIEETGMLDQMPESLRMYFDYQAFARDLLIGGDIAEFSAPDGTAYIVQTLF